MNRNAALPLALLLGACAATNGPALNDVVEDFVVVSELVEQDKVRTRGRYHYDALGNRYVILVADRTEYLVQFNRNCTELDETKVTPDIRREHNVLRARFDTIRGCRIHRIYAIDKGQAGELRQLAEKAADEG